ncbi:hypothetical protein HNP52_004596 [Sphingomonas kyeonggiensis]|uniref:Alginate export domain-containing protein n=1 Tax=Sphingomonas kyeonggiensis TaxID=1268553 RepID=A0A7W7K5L1_9SPHN|nr:alginate export family protein [Sphingomonas kyeonggiensis]MBB4841492.1 hypothetical protein [Sphingomonas kyeonggiensis]
MHFPRYFLALTLWPTAAAAQGLEVSGTVRLRYETIANQPRAGFNRDDALVNLRTTLLAKYDSGPVIFVAEVWDSRVYGGDGGTPVTTGESNALEMVQAYVARELSPGAGTRATIRGGRFTLNIGSRRLVAADDYRNTTNGYTGLNAEILAAGDVTANLIYVLPQQRRPDDPASLRRNAIALDREGFGLVLWGGTVAKNRAIGPLLLETSFYHLGERDTPRRPTRNRSLDTYGGRLLRDSSPGKLDVEIEAYYQSGTISASIAPNAARLPVSAWFVHGEAGYTFAAGWKPRLSVEYDRASGDRPGNRYGRFDTLFGMRRADLAPAGLYNAVGRSNISTGGVRVEVAPSKRLDGFVSYHALWLAERRDSFSTTAIRDGMGRSGNFAGHQFDARLRWWIRPAALRLEADAVLLSKGRFLEVAPNAPSGRKTRYASLNLTANF